MRVDCSTADLTWRNGNFELHWHEQTTRVRAEGYASLLSSRRVGEDVNDYIFKQNLDQLQDHHPVHLPGIIMTKCSLGQGLQARQQLIFGLSADVVLECSKSGQPKNCSSSTQTPLPSTTARRRPRPDTHVNYPMVSLAPLPMYSESMTIS